MNFKLTSLLALLALTGCVTSNLGHLGQLKPGTSLADVTQRLGKPTRTVAHADGGRSLEFSDQPHGNQCYMVRLDAKSNVVTARDMFSDDSIASIKRPMTKQQVAEMMCAPAIVSMMRTGEEAWDWNRISNSGHNGQRFVAYFRGDLLTRVEFVTVVMDEN